MDAHALLDSIPSTAVYALSAAVILVESIGIPFPGEIMLVGASLLASGPHAHVSIHLVALSATLGAIIGDSIGYYVGHRFGERLFARLADRFPEHVNDRTIGYAKYEFRRHGVWAVFFGRFVALLRIFAGPLAGSLRMPYTRFLLANALGAAGWAAGTAYGVYALGQVAERWLKSFSYVGLGVALVVGLGVSTLLRRRVSDRVDAWAAEREAAGEPLNPASVD